MTVTTILELAGAVVGKHNRLLVLVANDARLRIGKLAAARQLQLQEGAGTSERNPSAVGNAAAFAHGSPRRAINLVPEAFDSRMRSPPISLEFFNFLIGKLIRLEFAPGIETAGITKREITGLADGAFRRILIKAAVRYAEDFAGRYAIRLIARIAGSVKTAVLSSFHSSPATHASTRLSIELKSAPISTCPGAAMIMLRLQSPIIESGRG
jgi:hypothetical protein